MKKNKRAIFNGVFLIIVFVLTIYGVFHGEDLGAMMDAIRSADKRWLVPGLALVAFFIWGESIIIWYMMRSYGIKLKKRTCFLFSSVGFFFSCITPSASGGQPMQAYYMKKKNISIEKRRERTAYLFIAPAAILIIVFCIIPLIASFYISTQKMGVDLSDAEFVGFDNYKKIVGDRRFWQSVGITLKYTAAEIPLQMIIGVVLSALLAKNTRKNKIFRSIYFLPVIASAVTVGVTWQLVLHSNIGIFTYWLKLLGFSDINLLNNTSSAIFVVVFVAIWKTFGISTIILVAAIQNIPESLYEASAIDGAGKLSQFFHVTLPGIMPSFWFLLMTRIIGSLQMFDIVYTLTGGGPSRSTTTLVVYIYDTAFKSLGKTGYATAMSEVLFGFIMIITVIMYTIMNKTSDD